MRHALRHVLLIMLFLLAQAGALAHGLGHALDQAAPGGEPVCEQCLAFAAVGAGAASTPPIWSVPRPFIAFAALVPAATPSRFQAVYQSRAPPLR